MQKNATMDVRTQTANRSMRRTWSVLLLGIALLLALAPGTIRAAEGGKSGVKPQVISLPSGPGSIEGLGEVFEPDLSTGTASYPFPFTVAPARAGFAPDLALIYNGGNANGPWGMGWELNVPHIQRRTDAGLPVYDDAVDGFVHSSGEKLVGLANGDYRFENEGGFQRFRRLADGGWEAHMLDGNRLIFGASVAAREGNEHGIFRWRLERQINTHGNEIRYLYEQDGGYAYLTEVRYNFTQDGRYNAVLIHYEERPDVFSDRRSGAPITVRRRATELQVLALSKSVRSYRFDYVAEGSTGVHSLLAAITPIGADGVSELPPHTFTYTQFDPAAYETVYMQTPPALSLLDPDADLVDINADGLPDVVHTPPNGHRFFLNRGNGRWQEEAVLPAETPGDRLSSASTRMADMDGNGVVDLLVKAGSTPGTPFYYYTRGTSGQWELGARVIYGSSPGFALNEPNVEMIDVNHDKRIDVMVTASGQGFIWLAREEAWSPTADFIVPLPSLGGPISLENPRVHLGDMTGDRLQDLVFVQDGQVVYWPHNGNGDYGDAVFMQNPPRGLGNLDTTLLVGDLNNDGLDDLILPYNRSVRYWLNVGNGRYADPVTLSNTPGYNQMNVTVRLADMDGDGAVELLFSQFPAPAREILQYVDFSTGAQPFLLQSIDNGLGRRIEIEHRPSTDFYVEDTEAGQPWQNRPPFPVQVVSRVTMHDANSGDSYVTDYRYRDGYYDGVEKEFRGFARAEMVQHGDESAPTTVTRFVYDTGVENESRKGIVLETEILGEGGACAADYDECYLREVNQVTTRVLHDEGEGRQVAHSFVSQTDRFIHEQQAQPVQLRQTFDQDAYGNPTERFDYGQICGEDGDDLACGDDELLERMEYAINEDAWIVNRPSRVVQTDMDGNVVAETRSYYDGEPFVGLPLGQVTHGDLTRQEENLGSLGENRFVQTNRQAFDAHGNVTSIMDANGNVTNVAYDEVSQTFPVLERRELGAGQALTVTAAYDVRFGKVITATNYNGHASTFTYDTFGRVATMVYPGDTPERPTKRFHYDLGSPRSAITTEQREQSGSDDVLTSVVYFDGLGRPLQTRREAPDGQVVVTEAAAHNARQNVQHTFLPYFDSGFDYRAPELTRTHLIEHYDPLGRGVRTVNPDGTFVSTLYRPLVQIRYDEEDNAAGGPHAGTPRTLTYDGRARLVSVEEVNVVDGRPEHYLTRYTYDALGNLTQIEDADGNVKTMAYDALSRQVRMADPNRGATVSAYDDAGNLIRTEDAKGQIVRYSYDAANRLLREEWDVPGEETIVNAIYHYDDDISPLHPDAQNTLGEVAFIEDQVGTVHYSYDARGNMTGVIRTFAEEDLSFVTRLAYDAMDRLARLTYPDGNTVDYAYDARGMVTSIPGFVDAITYAPSGQRQTIRYSNGVESQYAYDERQRLRALQTVRDETTLQDLTYLFDGVGNVVAIGDGRADRALENDSSQSFVYDSLYRLVHAAGTYGAIDYGYDATGNLVRKTSTASDPRLNLGELRYGENEAGPYALTSVNGNSLAYDANGNLAQKGAAHYNWDPRDRLLAVTDDAMQTTYRYDSEGRRTHQAVQQGPTMTTTLYLSQYAEVRGDEFVRYIFDGEQRIAQVTSPFDPEQLLSGFAALQKNSVPAGETHWYLTDHLGGTNLLLDEQGSVVSEVAYYPFGLSRYERDANGIHHRFTGKEMDVNGLHHFGNRYYDALTGRFLSVDPLWAEVPGKRVSNPQLLNLYAYTLNNPVRYVDPSGMQPEAPQTSKPKPEYENLKYVNLSTPAVPDHALGPVFGPTIGMVEGLFKGLDPNQDGAARASGWIAAVSGFAGKFGFAAGLSPVYSASASALAARLGAFSMVGGILSVQIDMIANLGRARLKAIEHNKARGALMGFSIGFTSAVFGKDGQWVANNFGNRGIAPNVFRHALLQGWNDGLAAGYEAGLQLSPEQKKQFLTDMNNVIIKSGNINLLKAAETDHDITLEYSRALLSTLRELDDK